MSEAQKGILAMVVACTIWGLAPLYWVHLSHVPPLEIIAHRTIWSAVTFLVVLLLQKRLGVLWAALSSGSNIAISLSSSHFSPLFPFLSSSTPLSFSLFICPPFTSYPTSLSL